MFKFQRYPLGTPLYVRAEQVVAISVFQVGLPQACVIHIANDGREAVWGNIEDVAKCFNYIKLYDEEMGQAAYNGRVDMLQTQYGGLNASATEKE